MKSRIQALGLFHLSGFINGDLHPGPGGLIIHLKEANESASHFRMVGRQFDSNGAATEKEQIRGEGGGRTS